MHFKHNFFFTIFFPKVRIMSAWSHPILGKISKLFFEGFPKDCAASCTVRCGIFMWVLWKKNQNLILILIFEMSQKFSILMVLIEVTDKKQRKSEIMLIWANPVFLKPTPNQYQYAQYPINTRITILNVNKTSWPYFLVKLSCFCLKFASKIKEKKFEGDP